MIARTGWLTVVALAISFTSSSSASAQGTVSWSSGFPAGGTGFFDVKGTYTENTGWVIAGAALQYEKQQAGGSLQQIEALYYSNGVIGVSDPLTPGTVTHRRMFVAAGTYAVRIAVTFRNITTQQTLQLTTISYNVTVH